MITDRSAEELQKSFPYEGTHGELNRLMLVRQPWARGVEFRRPDTASVEAFLFPPPDKADAQSDYIDTLCDNLRAVFSELVDAVVPAEHTPAERLSSLDRIQFVVQEQFDRFGGVFPFRRSVARRISAQRKPNGAYATQAREQKTGQRRRAAAPATKRPTRCLLDAPTPITSSS